MDKWQKRQKNKRTKEQFPQIQWNRLCVSVRYVIFFVRKEFSTIEKRITVSLGQIRREDEKEERSFNDFHVDCWQRQWGERNISVYMQYFPENVFLKIAFWKLLYGIKIIVFFTDLWKRGRNEENLWEGDVKNLMQ